MLDPEEAVKNEMEQETLYLLPPSFYSWILDWGLRSEGPRDASLQLGTPWDAA